MKMLKPADREDFLFRYVFFAMKTIHYKPGSHSRQWISKYSKITIPVPPVEVQRAIVEILDTFTELEAELEARTKQYEHYRDELFTFHEGEMEYKPLGEVGSFSRGGGPQKKDFTDEGFGCIHYGQIYTHYGMWTRETKSFISDAVASKSKKAEPGDVIIASTGENDEELGFGVAWLGGESIAVSNHTLIYTSDLDPKFVSYFLRSTMFQKQKRRRITGTKVRALSEQSVAKIEIPVPSPEVQRAIVDTLDKFDALVNDLSSGLPAEIEARRKQYAYYRNQLFSFPEKA